jgi:hypothetical protein
MKRETGIAIVAIWLSVAAVCGAVIVSRHGEDAAQVVFAACVILFAATTKLTVAGPGEFEKTGDEEK